jgi:spore coat protein U domain-containing protein, fimbrial subunit CupE1/2/3/6
MKRFLIAATALVGVVAGTDAWASTVGTTMGVSASVATACSVSVSGPLAFGQVNVGAVTDATSTVTVTCTNGGTYDVGLNFGLNASPATQRNLIGTNLATLLTYGLFSDSSHGVPWGNTVSTDTVHSTGSGAAQAITVYGRMPSQVLTVDSYSDTVAVTVTY